MFDPNYKLRHRVPPARRLLHYRTTGDVPPHIGDPPGLRNIEDWGERCRVLYEWTMRKRDALWFWR